MVYFCVEDPYCFYQPKTFPVHYKLFGLFCWHTSVEQHVKRSAKNKGNSKTICPISAQEVWVALFASAVPELKIRTLWWAFRFSLHVYFTDWTKCSVSRMSGCSHCMITCVKPINFVHPYDLEADGPALRTTELSWCRGQIPKRLAIRKVTRQCTAWSAVKYRSCWMTVCLSWC